MAPREAGGFIGGSYDGFVAFDFDALRFEPLGDPEPSFPSNRFNDGKTDRQGRFWAGTMDRHEREANGSLYRLDPDLNWTRIDTGYRVTNGPAFSLDGKTMYHSDSALQCIYAFDLDRAGAASARRVFAQFGAGEGYPDGMTVDAQDCLWVAFWDGWCLRRLSPSGETLAKIPLPVQQPTSCAFGGEDYTLLFVTSARRGLDAEQLAQQSTAGGLFEIAGLGRGVAETPFCG